LLDDLAYVNWFLTVRPTTKIRHDDYAHSCRVHNTGNEADKLILKMHANGAKVRQGAIPELIVIAFIWQKHVLHNYA